MSEMTMIERAARALCEAQYQKPDDMIRQGSTTFQTTASSQLRSAVPEVPRWLTRVDEARAVLAAIRDPDEAMVSAMVERGSSSGYTDVVGLWRAGIEAAMVEAQSSRIA